MASIQAKIGWKRQRKRENKNYLSVPFQSYPYNKIQKIKKYHYGFLRRQNRMEKVENETK